MKIALVLFAVLSLSIAAYPTGGSTSPSIRVAPPAPKITDVERQSELAKRRAAVAAKMVDDSILVMWSAEPRNYAGNVDFMYRQENNLYYLTALKQGGATFVMTKSGGKVNEYLFLRSRDPRYEAWNGRMYSNEDARRLSGISTIIDSAELADFLGALRERREFTAKSATRIDPVRANLYLLTPNSDNDPNGLEEFRRERDFAATVSGVKVVNARPIFEDLRQIKSPYEIRIMQHAIDITTEAQMRSMAMVGRANWEYEVHAEVDYTFRRRNADYWGYPSIVGCGPNATTLHYTESQSPVVKGQLLLMDVGAEYDHYTADVTRTFPVNGKFTKEQREIYQIVYDAQEAVAAAAKPGVQFSQLTAIAQSTIGDGLLRLGLITKKDREQIGIWFIHGLGHWLGMNVHDVGRYSNPLAPGMVFTNEPGVYIREDALMYLPDKPEWREFRDKVTPAFERYKNIGVRIEDDLLVTQNGVEWMTKALPRRADEVENFMARASKEFNYSSRLRGEPNNILLSTIGEPASSTFASYPSGATTRTGFVRFGETGHGHAD